MERVEENIKLRSKRGQMDVHLCVCLKTSSAHEERKIQCIKLQKDFNKITLQQAILASYKKLFHFTKSFLILYCFTLVQEFNLSNMIIHHKIENMSQSLASFFYHNKQILLSQ